MNRTALFKFGVSIFVLVVFWGCTSASTGPQTWIDFPINNESYPLAPLKIMAHAAHTEGVNQIEFFINGENIKVVDVKGRPLEDATIEWNPTQYGRYTIEARGVASSGQAGMHAVSVIYVGEEGATSTQKPTQWETGTVTQIGTRELPTTTSILTPSFTSTKTSLTKPPYIQTTQNTNCLKCPNTSCESVTYLNTGQQAVIEGRLADNSWLLVRPTGATNSCWIQSSIIDVFGDLNLIAVVLPPPQPLKTMTPTATRTPTAVPTRTQTRTPTAVPTRTQTRTPAITITTPAPDNTPPTIISLSMTPDTIYSGCSSGSPYPTSSISRVTATDNVKIKYVTAEWFLVDNITHTTVASGTIVYFQIDLINFEGAAGPVSTDGIIYINGLVVDTSDKSTPFNQNLTVISCIG